MIRRDNVVIGIVLLALDAGYIWMITKLPTRNLANTLGIDFMPWLYAILLGALSLMLIVNSLLGLQDGCETGPPVAATHVRGIALVFAIFVVYIFLIDRVGFLLVTPLMAGSLMYIEGNRNFRSIGTTAVGITVGVFVVFRYVFEVSITGIAFL
jgi:putative tricarboxylic transport membrane protein